MRITALNDIDSAHLADIMAEMAILGAPTVRAVETANGLVAIEGSHRLEAALRLGITPSIIVIDPTDMIDGRSLNDIRTDVFANCDCDGASSLDFVVAGSELAAFLDMPSGATYSF